MQKSGEKKKELRLQGDIALQRGKGIQQTTLLTVDLTCQIVDESACQMTQWMMHTERVNLG